MPNISDNATETTLQLYANPQMIQATALEKLQKQVLGGQPVVDGNNVVTFLLEMCASLVSGATNEVTNAFESLYPSRAHKTSDLYRHMSDYDYANLYATPASTSVELVFDRNFIINNAVEDGDNTNYKKIVIPSYSTFKIGEYTFGIHYPIEIRVRVAYDEQGEIEYDNCNIQCSWDNSVSNPLFVLESNIIEHRTILRDGINLLCLTIPLKQFVIDTQIADAVPSTGFIKRFEYTDKFYVIRVFNYVADGNGDIEWQEMSQTFSDIIYDPNYPTAKISVLTDINSVEVYIPQIYFDKGLIGPRIKCMIYTTQGALDVDISSYNTDQFGASFMIEDEIGDDKYTSMLKRLSVCFVLPLASKISSGSNGLTFEELRRRVVNDSTYSLLITANDLINYFADQGFKAKRYIDNITDRIYLAQKILTDSKSVAIAAGDLTTEFDSSDLKYTVEPEGTYYTNHDTFRFIDSKNTMILPTTIYKYEVASNTCRPMTNDWYTQFKNMTPEQKVKELNENIYTFSPFHMKLSTESTVPVAGYFDLLKPTISKVTFKGENIGTNTQVSMYSCSVKHLENGTGGYILDISLFKTSDLEKYKPEMVEGDFVKKNIQVVLRYKTAGGLYRHQIGQYIGDNEGRNIIRFYINTSYKLDSSNSLDTTSFRSIDGLNVNGYIPLNTECELLFYVNEELIPGNFINQIDISEQPFDPELVCAIPTVYQTFHLKLGEPITNLFTNVYVNVEEQTYLRYPTTQYATYTEEKYQRYTQEDYDEGRLADPDLIGTYIYPLKVIHEIGDVIISSNTGSYIPPACSVNITNYIEETDTKIKTTKTLYLNEPYTATSYPTNTFMPKEYDKSNITEDVLTSYKLEIMDGLQFIYDYLTSDPDHVKTDNYSDLRLKFEDKVVNRYVTIDDVGKYIILGNEKFLLTRTNIEAYVGGLYNVYLGRKVIDPVEGMALMMVGDITGDNSDVESDITIVSAGEYYLYRRNPEYTNFNYAEIYHNNTDDSSYVAFNGDKLEELYNDVDDDQFNQNEILNKWGISIANFKALMNARAPWIKVMRIGTVDDLLEFINRRQIINTTAPVVQDIHNTMTTVDVFDKQADFDEVDSSEYEYVYINDLEGVMVGSDGADPLFGNISESRTKFGGLLRIVDNTRKLLIIGDSKRECIDFIKNINCYSGFVYVISSISGLTNNSGIVTDIKFNKAYYQFMSFDEYGHLNLDMGSSLMNWSLIDKWPWEVDQSKWVDINTGNYADNLEINIDRNTDAKILHEAGDVTVTSGTSSIQTYVTDANGDVIDAGSSTATTRLITYNIRMLHCDYKLLLSSEPEHADFRNDIVEELRAYFNSINDAKKALLEDTNLYYTPLRTIGYAKYKGTNSIVDTRPLDVTLAFRLHVENFVQNSNNNKESIKESILQIIDKHIATGVVSAVAIANDIRDSLSDTILYVDCLGINGDKDLQTIILADDECVPHLKQELILNDDGSIGVNRGVTLEWSVVK